MPRILPNTKISLKKSYKLPIKSIFSYIKSLRLFKPHIKNTVTIYGSARTTKDNPIYQETLLLGKALSDNGFCVMTGGGPGLMQAANKGAQQGPQPSLGCCIKIPNEQGCNPFLDKQITCDYFFIRKVILTRFSCAFIAAPGGYGTLDELFEILNLIITHKIKNYPVILFGKEYWEPLLDFLKNSALKNQTINASDLSYITVSDDPMEICEIIKKCTSQ